MSAAYIFASIFICMNVVLVSVGRLLSAAERLGEREVSLQQVLTSCPPLR